MRSLNLVYVLQAASSSAHIAVEIRDSNNKCADGSGTSGTGVSGAPIDGLPVPALPASAIPIASPALPISGGSTGALPPVPALG